MKHFTPFFIALFTLTIAGQACKKETKADPNANVYVNYTVWTNDSTWINQKPQNSISVAMDPDGYNYVHLFYATTTTPASCGTGTYTQNFVIHPGSHVLQALETGVNFTGPHTWHTTINVPNDSCNGTCLNAY